MNIFNQYGIKEVADVTFYSITRVGDEEFYTPVLFFDTLKVSTVKKTVKTVNATGGKGNGKVISWNFGKEITLSLEDALFSDASLDMFLNGRIQTKLADWTSVIAKLNTANKYGRLHYSTKAYPSPQLTMSEWEIVFRCAEKAGYSAKYGDAGLTLDASDNKEYSYRYQYDTIRGDKEGDQFVAENRKYLTQKYMNRNQLSPQSRNVAYFYDINDGYSGVDIRIVDEKVDTDFTESVETGGTKIYIESSNSWYTEEAAAEYIKARIDNAATNNTVETLVLKKNIYVRYVQNGSICYRTGTITAWISITAQGFYCRATYLEFSNSTDVLNNPYCGRDTFNDHIFYYLFPNYLGTIIDLCYCDLQDKFYLAMPPIVINEIVKEIDSVHKIGKIENDLYDSQYIDRFEKCVVTNRDGFTIDAGQQRENLVKYYNNVTDESYTIYYDAKTMLPLFTGENFNIEPYTKQYIKNTESIEITDSTVLLSISKSIEEKSACYYDFPYQVAYQIALVGIDLISLIGNSIADWVAAQVEDFDHLEDIIFIGGLDENGLPVGITVETDGYTITKITFDTNSLLIKYVQKNPNLFKIKRNTIYYKWTRTVDEAGSIFTTIGTDLIISADTFPSEYRIVGETYIREQKTGKDQRCQIVFPRAKISPATDIKLQADGDPVTFSIDVNILMPKDKVMMELRQFDVEEDKREGGFRIIPQDKRYSYTPTNQEYVDTVIDNNEIY